MKKKQYVLLLCALLLCGCGQRGGAATGGGRSGAALSLNGVAYTGSCTAPKEDGLYHGEGSFTAEEGWVYTGSFEQGSFGKGSVTEMPVTVEFGGVRTEGSYTGAVSSLTPDGTGRFDFEGGSFSGRFLDGVPDSGEGENLPVSLPLCGEQLTGVYSGTLSDGSFSGSGHFESDDAGRHAIFDGSFTGEGELYFDGINIGGDRGVYSGQTENGLPSGQGSFTGRNSDNIDYTYNGEWKNGLYDGQGSLIYDCELYYDRVGTFTAGRFTPTALEELTALGTAGVRFTLSDKMKSFLSQYPEIFDFNEKLSSYAECEYRFLWNLYQTYPVYKAEPDKYEGTWMCFFNERILYQWTEDSFGEDYRVTCVLATTTLYTEPVLAFVFGNVDNLATAGSYNAYGIPLGMSTYTNVDGDAVPVMVMMVGAMTTFR